MIGRIALFNEIATRKAGTLSFPTNRMLRIHATIAKSCKMPRQVRLEQCATMDGEGEKRGGRCETLPSRMASDFEVGVQMRPTSPVLSVRAHQSIL